MIITHLWMKTIFLNKAEPNQELTILAILKDLVEVMQRLGML